MAGVHAGRVLTNNMGSGILRGNFEYAVELFPYWQSFTPKFQKVNCTQAAKHSASSPARLRLPVGGTFGGITVTPIILRWNFRAARGRVTPWVQGAGGLLWTNHKYPAYGDTTINIHNNGPNGDASVWNFTPQGGIGMHYFTRQRPLARLQRQRGPHFFRVAGRSQPGSERHGAVFGRLHVVEVAADLSDCGPL